ncbi:MAG TPA: 50S ribosomal protein L9 [Bacilli bacterium]|nr:50S ribosomal protein L9 [Bacilli bacterium]HPS18831.1 50S ribosomal protein L9 [Bacilli bacterium]
MKVILLKDVKKVGKKDQTIEVSDGYATNYLIPNKLAVQVTKKSLEVLDSQKQLVIDNEAKAKENAMKIAKQLESITLTIPMKCGKDGKLFGNVSLKRVEEELTNTFHVEIDKRKFLDKGSLDNLGFFKLSIELHKGVVGYVNVHVVEEGK